ncbi:MAG: helix-turn-helix domain-containing protein [Solirubrobacterales bacterium]
MALPRDPLSADDRRVLGAAIREAREAAGISPTDLSGRSGLPLSLILEIESGEKEPRWGTMRSLAQGTGLPLEKLCELVAAHEDRAG